MKALKRCLATAGAAILVCFLSLSPATAGSFTFATGKCATGNVCTQFWGNLSA